MTMPAKDPVRRFAAQVVQNHRKRLLHPLQTVDYSTDDIEALVRDALTRCCRYCKARLTLANLSVDHRTPVSRGGSFTLDNLDADLCRECNEKKADVLASEWGRLVALVDDFSYQSQRSIYSRLRMAGKLKGGRR